MIEFYTYKSIVEQIHVKFTYFNYFGKFFSMKRKIVVIDGFTFNLL